MWSISLYNLGITNLLQEGYVITNQSGKTEYHKALEIPGIGWVPCSSDLLKNYTNNPRHLALYYRTGDEKVKYVFQHLVGTSCISYSPILDDHKTKSLLTFYLQNNLDNRITLYYNSIRNNPVYEHMIITDGGKENAYFIPLPQAFDGVDKIVVSEKMANHIRKNGFDGLVIKCTNILELGFPEDEDIEQLRIDEILTFHKLSDNKYDTEPNRDIPNYRTLVYNGDTPCYLMEKLECGQSHLPHCINRPWDKPWDDELYKGSDSYAEQEVEELVEFFKNMGFTYSSEISNYIQENKLGYKYKHISGYLELSDGTDHWEFEGGISPRYYREICERLKLSNEGSRSHVIGFQSYDSLS